MADAVDDRAFTEANRAYFDSIASKYASKPWQQKLMSQSMAEIQSKIDFIGLDPRDPKSPQSSEAKRKVKLLDYACGTGMVSRALSPYITHTTGIDISSSMIAAFNTAFPPSSDSTTPTADSMIGDLLTTPPSPPLDTLQGFDIAAVGYALHHFADPALAVRRLVQCLRPGGVLFVVDFCAGERGADGHVHELGHGHGHGHHHGHGHGHGEGDGKGEAGSWTKFSASHTIKTHGFTEEGLREVFEAEGLEGFKWSEMAEEVEMRFPAKKGGDHKEESHTEADGEEKIVWRRAFLARGTRAAARNMFTCKLIKLKRGLDDKFKELIEDM